MTQPEPGEFRRPPRPVVPRVTPVPHIPPVPRDFDDDEPAAVVTEHGTYGKLPEERWAPPQREPRTFSAALARLAAWGLAGFATLWLAMFAAWQDTSRAVAIPALERGLSSLTEVDALLSLHHDDIVAAAVSRAGDPRARVNLPGFPIPDATLSAAEALDDKPAVQRTLLLHRAATVIYEQGLVAMRAEGGTQTRTGIFATSGAARRVLGGLSLANHQRAGTLLLPIGAAVLAMAGAVILLGTGFRRFMVIGAALVVAAGFVAIGALLVLGLVTVVGTDGSVLASELSEIMKALAWTPIRDAAWLAVAGIAIALPAAVLGFVFARVGDDDGYVDQR